MNTKESVLAYLEARKGTHVSGTTIAAQIGLSRNAVWKAIKALQEDGYPIQGITNKGYCLHKDYNKLSAVTISRFINDPRISLEFHDVIDSTNDRAKKLAELGIPEGVLVVSNQQTAGKGRQGRAFYSPAGTGIYFSLVLRPKFGLEDVSLITSYAALCCAKAIDEVLGVETQIKWVNDIFCNGHKVSGILTEAAILPETGSINYVVVGIGVNVSVPEGGFPQELNGVAHGIIKGNPDVGDARARIVARTVDHFFAQYECISDKPHLQEYREKSLLNGKTVQAFCSHDEFTATVIGINDDLTLEVELADGSRKALGHGEVHIPSSQL